MCPHRLAKAKRERLRQAHLAPDYIPLGGATRLLATGGAAAGDGSSFKAAEEALGSGSDEEQEEQMRLQFMGKKDATAGNVNGGEGRFDARNTGIACAEHGHGGIVFKISECWRPPSFSAM